MYTSGVQGSSPQNSSSGNTSTAHTTPRSAIPPDQDNSRQYVEFALRAVANIKFRNPLEAIDEEDALIDPEMAALDRMAKEMLENALARRKSS